MILYLYVSVYVSIFLPFRLKLSGAIQFFLSSSSSFLSLSPSLSLSLSIPLSLSLPLSSPPTLPFSFSSDRILSPFEKTECFQNDELRATYIEGSVLSNTLAALYIDDKCHIFTIVKTGVRRCGIYHRYTMLPMCLIKRILRYRLLLVRRFESIQSFQMD